MGRGVRWSRVAGAGLVFVVVAGCGSPLAGPTTTSTTTPPITAPLIAVDLEFTGAFTFGAHGVVGECQISSNGDSTKFSFLSSEMDYPGFGQVFQVAESFNDYVGIKWIIDNTTVYTDTSDIVALSPDHLTVTIDGDLTSSPPAEPVHVRGTITCPG